MVILQLLGWHHLDGRELLQLLEPRILSEAGLALIVGRPETQPGVTVEVDILVGGLELSERLAECALKA